MEQIYVAQTCEFCPKKLRDDNKSGVCYHHNNRTDSHRALIAKRYIDRRAFVDAIKLTVGCADCGYRAEACALDFDHLPGYSKTYTVSQMLTRSYLIIMAEIDKCEVVCANCHRIRTRKRPMPWRRLPER